MDSHNILFNIELRKPAAADGKKTSAERQNAARCSLNDNTCPDCRISLVRLGNCFSCPVCGYGGCD